ncbi:MAG: undecaprenyldiphospho-muramoylpentapeptide beta-N-acetylglucosaminyltransferase [Gemmatimonadales bacterium]|nr:undecaprenyldiphospho-muramoylpentapeptide beta-N-acetylglucosaminyltransferase [Gemmatimonadales bacterium]
MSRSPGSRAEYLAARRVLITGGGTGGHLMPALAIAARLREAAPDVEPVLVGARRGIETDVLARRAFRYHLLPAQPIYRRQWWKNVRWPFILPGLWRGLRAVFARERPAAVLGTGGYASAPVVWWALRRGIPVALQEQNAYPGLVTRRFAARAQHVYLGLPEARQHLRLGPHTKILVTGNPIVPPTPGNRVAERAGFGLGQGEFTLLVTGGSQGALDINRAVAAWLDAGASPGVSVLWITGHLSYAEFKRYHAPPRVHVIDFLDPMARGYAVADVVVSRAGALTVAELCAWGLPSILIPLPSAAAHHQAKNADAMEQAGAAVHLNQAHLDAGTLSAAIHRLQTGAATRQAMSRAARARGRPDAAGDIVSNLLTLLESGGVSQVTETT